MNVNLDKFDWNRNRHLCIINGIITDRRLMGNSINLPSYRTARRGREYGYENCPICGELYAKSLRCNHVVSRVHMDFIKTSYVLREIEAKSSNGCPEID